MNEKSWLKRKKECDETEQQTSIFFHGQKSTLDNYVLLSTTKSHVCMHSCIEKQKTNINNFQKRILNNIYVF